MKPMLAAAMALATVLLLPEAVSAQLLPPNEAGVTMGHVHLNVTDIEVHKKFWTDHFGATPLAREGLQGVRVPGMLILLTKRDPTHATQGTVLDHFGFKVRSLPEMLASFRAAGVTVQSEFKGNEGFPNAYVVGPDNVRIEMQEDTTLPVRAASHHLHYMLADPIAHRTWYIEKLALTATRRGTFETANASGMNLTFSASKTSPPIGTRGGSLDHIGFEVKDLEAYCKKLEASGIKLDVPYRKVPNLGIAIAFITDPSGVYIELTEGLGAYLRVLAAMPTWKDAVRIGLTLRDTEESTWYRTPALKVGGKGFARLRTEAEGGLVLMCSLDEKARLLESGDAAYYTTPHYDGYGAILVDLKHVGRAALRELVMQSWRIKASPKLRKAFDARTQGWNAGPA